MLKTLGVAVLNRGDLLLRCIASIDHPVEHLFLIDNGNDGGVRHTLEQVRTRKIGNAALFSRITIEKHRNLGCGPSWNRITKESPGPWLICGSDVQFSEKKLALIEARSLEHPDASIICAFGYNAFMLTELGVRKVGMFDENFYPAYFEDVDHFRRVALSGAKAVDVPGFHCVHGEAPLWGSSTVSSDPSLKARNGITFANNRDYYIRKWGGPPAQEKWRRPFNRDVPLDWWVLDAALRKKNSLW